MLHNRFAFNTLKMFSWEVSDPAGTGDSHLKKTGMLVLPFRG